RAPHHRRRVGSEQRRAPHVEVRADGDLPRALPAEPGRLVHDPRRVIGAVRPAGLRRQAHPRPSWQPRRDPRRRTAGRGPLSRRSPGCGGRGCVSMHPRLAINSLSTATWPLERDLEEYAALGVGRVTLYYDKLEAVGIDKGIELVRSAGLDVLSVFTRGVTLCQPELWAAEQARLRSVLGTATALGAHLVIITTGAIGDMTWDEGVDALNRSLEPLRAPCEAGSITIGIEQTLPVRL